MENEFINIDKLVEFSKTREGKETILNLINLLKEPVEHDDWGEALNIVLDLQALLYHNLFLNVLKKTKDEEQRKINQDNDGDNYGDLIYN